MSNFDGEPEYSWRYDARCAGVDTDLFYPPRSKNEYKLIADKAKVYCFGTNGSNPCPVRSECLWDAVSREEPHGIWGGLSHRERNALVRKWTRAKQNKRTELSLKEFIYQQ